MCNLVGVEAINFINSSFCHHLVPSQPRQVLSRTISSNAIFVNWTEPAEMNGVLVKYQVIIIIIMIIEIYIVQTPYT